MSSPLDMVLLISWGRDFLSPMRCLSSDTSLATHTHRTQKALGAAGVTFTFRAQRLKLLNSSDEVSPEAAAGSWTALPRLCKPTARYSAAQGLLDSLLLPTSPAKEC